MGSGKNIGKRRLLGGIAVSRSVILNENVFFLPSGHLALSGDNTVFHSVGREWRVSATGI